MRVNAALTLTDGAGEESLFINDGICIKAKNPKPIK
jgi:hypothetical protein